MSLAYLQSSPGEEPVIVEGEFAAPPERVFQAWTDAKEVAQWFGPGTTGISSADIDLNVGGSWRFEYAARDGRRDVLRGEYKEIRPGSRLVFTWIHERSSDDNGVETTTPSQVTVTFAPTDGGTFVRLVHERIVREAGRLGVGDGWNGSFASLQTFLQTDQEENTHDGN